MVTGFLACGATKVRQKTNTISKYLNDMGLIMDRPIHHRSDRESAGERCVSQNSGSKIGFKIKERKFNEFRL